MKAYIKKITVLLALAATLVLVPLNSGIAHAANFCVSKGAPPCPFSNIQAAVDAAAEGQVINVYPGSYRGGVIVDKGVTIQGIGTVGQVRVVGTAGVLYGFMVGAKASPGPSVKIMNLDISGFKGQKNAAGILIGGVFPGDQDNHVGGVTVQNNRLHDNADGIYLWQTNGNSILSNTIYNNTDATGIEGIGIMVFDGINDKQIKSGGNWSGKDNAMNGNIIYGNNRFGIFAGACMQGVPGCPAAMTLSAVLDGTVIQTNRVYSNGNTGGAGIGLMNASGASVTNNYIHNDKASGLFLRSASRMNIAGNHVDNNVGAGIYVLKSTANRFTRNSANGNGPSFDLYWDQVGSQTFGANSCQYAFPNNSTWGCQ